MDRMIAHLTSERSANYATVTTSHASRTDAVQDFLMMKTGLSLRIKKLDSRLTVSLTFMSSNVKSPSNTMLALATLKIINVDGLYNYYSNVLAQIPDDYGDLTSKCRVCLREGKSSIFDKEDTVQILEVLQAFGNITVTKDDHYTKLLCSTCYKFIKQAIAFRKVAMRSADNLKNVAKEETDKSMDEQDFGDGYEPDVIEKWNSTTETSDSKQKCKLKTENKAKHQYSSKVTCQICKKVINRSYFKEHVTMHEPNHKRYICDVCGKSFRLRCAYHNHSLRHSTGFSFKCQFCPYRAQYAELLKTHLRTHTGDFRYMCTECPARFLVKSNLNSHMLKHKEPQFKCDACKRAFHTNLMLQRHYQSDHLGIKNHVCSICGKAFGYRNAMMKHQRRVHKREKISFGRMPSYLQAENDQIKLSQVS